MNIKGKGKDVAVKSKKEAKPKKAAGAKAGPSPSRHDVIFELPLRVRAASREEANLLALRWLTDALLKAERPAAIRVSTPHRAGAAATVPPGTVSDERPPAGETAAAQDSPEAAPDGPAEEVSPVPRASRASRKQRQASAAGNGVA